MPLADHQLTLEHEKLLWDTKELDLNTSKGLLQAVIFYLIKCFAVWQDKELRQLQTSQISFGEDKLGKFVTLDLESSNFKKRCVKRYDDPANPRSVYKILKKYRNRIPNEGPFIVRPISSIKDFICYSPLPLGVKVIKTFISSLMEDAGIGRCFVNYSLNLHSIDTLMRFGTGFHCLSSWLVKNSIKNFPASPECGTTNCEELNPEVSVMISRLLDAPYPLDAVEILQKMEQEEEKRSNGTNSVLPPNFDSWMTNLMKNSLNMKRQKDSQILESQRMVTSDVEETENKFSSCSVSSCKINILSPDINEEMSHEDEKATHKDFCTSEDGSDRCHPRIMAVSSITECAFSLQVDEGDRIFEREAIDKNDFKEERKGVGEKNEMDSLTPKQQSNIPSNFERIEGESVKKGVDSLSSKMRKKKSIDCKKKGRSERSEPESLFSKRRKNITVDCERKGRGEKSILESLFAKRRKKITLGCKRKGRSENSELDSLASKRRKNVALDRERKGRGLKSEPESLFSKRGKNIALDRKKREKSEKSELDFLALKRPKTTALDCEIKGENEESEMDSLGSKNQESDTLDCEVKSEETAGKRLKTNNGNKTFSFLKTMLETNMNYNEINNRSRNTLAFNDEQMNSEAGHEMDNTDRIISNSKMDDKEEETTVKSVYSSHHLQVDEPSCRNNTSPPSHRLGEEKAAKATEEQKPPAKNCSCTLRNPDSSRDSITILRMLLRNPSGEEKRSAEKKDVEKEEFHRKECNKNLMDQSVDIELESDNCIANTSQTKKYDTVDKCKNKSAAQFDTQDMQSLMDLSPPTLSPQPPVSVQEKGDVNADPKTSTCSEDESLSCQFAPNLVSADIVQFLDKANQQMKSILNASATKSDPHKVNPEKSPGPTSLKQSEPSSSMKIMFRHSRKSKKPVKVISASPAEKPSPTEINLGSESDASPKSAKFSKQSQLQFPLLRMFLEQSSKDTDVVSDSQSPYNSTTLKSKQKSNNDIPTNSLIISDAQKDSGELPKLTFMGDTSASPDNHGYKKLSQSKLEMPSITKTQAGFIPLSDKDSECPQLVPSFSSSPVMLSLPASPCAALDSCSSNTAEYHVEKDLVNKTVYQNLCINDEKDGGLKTFTFADIPIVSDSSSLSKGGKGSKQTSEINLGDYFPPGTLIPAKDIHLITQQGPDGCDIVMKFKFSQKN